MLLALFSDIHANREAFQAVLTVAERAGADRLVILGDIVGYGADPEWCTAKVMALAEQGAAVVRGNHDQAVGDPDVSLNAVARFAMEWTRNQLDAPLRRFLADLPLQIHEDDRLYVHADASAPGRWNYVVDGDCARRHLSACPARVSFCGHVHRPALYGLSDTGKLASFVPTAMTAVPLLPQRQWLAVMGAVGQPRDGNPAAAFGLYDVATRELCFMRVAYDVDLAAEKIRAAGLPEALATRLQRGE